ncbi:MAG: hypothetical protein AAFY29_11755 [Pseudomonadota bacterium]
MPTIGLWPLQTVVGVTLLALASGSTPAAENEQAPRTQSPGSVTDSVSNAGSEDNSLTVYIARKTITMNPGSPETTAFAADELK